MKPTNEQIIAEAHRRFVEEQRNHDGLTPEGSSFSDHIIEVMREGWTPPEPVDPDLLAFREFASKAARSASLAQSYRDGGMDSCVSAHLFLAGARMAREQERERANHPIAFAVRVMAGVFKDLDHAKREAREALARIPGRA